MTEIFNIDFEAKETARCRWVLDISGTHCKCTAYSINFAIILVSVQSDTRTL